MLTRKKIILAKKNGTLDELYGQEVTKLVRRRHTVSGELAINRQKDEKPEEFAEYYAYCEECKQDVKDIISEAIGSDYSAK